MMKLRRGPFVVLGLTNQNVEDLRAGRVIQVRGEDIDAPGVTLQLIFGESHEEMRAILRANGYDIPYDGDGNGDGNGNGHNGDAANGE